MANQEIFDFASSLDRSHFIDNERIPELAQSARKKLEALGITNISYSVGDGSTGWPQYAPYDRIIVTAAARIMPEELVCQLKEGGIMIFPMGPRGVQELLKVTRKPDGEIRIQSIEYVRFVELRGKYGWSEDAKDTASEYYTS